MNSSRPRNGKNKARSFSLGGMRIGTTPLEIEGLGTAKAPLEKCLLVSSSTPQHTSPDENLWRQARFLSICRRDCLRTTGLQKIFHPGLHISQILFLKNSAKKDAILIWLKAIIIKYKKATGPQMTNGKTYLMRTLLLPAPPKGRTNAKVLPKHKIKKETKSFKNIY